MTRELEQAIYELLKKFVLPIVRNDNDLMNILSSLWNVYERNATGEDFRYKILGNEIEKHYIMNTDWADDKLFIGVLKLYDDEKKFIELTEQLTNMVRGCDGFDEYKANLTSLLKEAELALIFEQNEYRIGAKGSTQSIPKDALKFFVCKSDVTNAVRFIEKDVQWPVENNCFVLTFDYGWNDYSCKTRYRLYYVKDNQPTEIGQVKIMKKNAMDTSEHLPAQFVALGNDFCSLGMNTNYYQRIRELLGNEAHIVLSQLRDTAFFESIYKQFEDESEYKTSLLRDNDSDKARREGRYCIYGRDLRDAYAFTYKFELPYPGEAVEIDFNYKYIGKDYERIIGLIGENGVGKTSLINAILTSLVNNDNRNFVGLRPLFSSVLVISYSPFDHYHVDTNDKTPFINYEYSGLMKDKEQMYSTSDQVKILIENIKVIYHRQYRFSSTWEALLSKVMNIGNITRLITEGVGDLVDVDEEGLLELCENASSGETMFLYSISAIMAKIRSDSLIIMDEPEQHLHPSAVTALMHSLYKILERYDSYALISTHSPYVIRELVSPNVHIFKRYDGGLSVKRIGIESFGEDVSVLSDIVFGNMSEAKRYEKYIEEVVKKNSYDYAASVRELQTGPNELGLNAKLMVRTIINRNQNETLEA